METRALVLLSGGVDSAVSLYWARARHWRIFPIEFEYHGRPERERRACRELRACAAITESISIPVPFLKEVVDIPAAEIGNPVLAEAPEGYIPVRNLVFYAIAAHQAEILGARYIVGGHNRTDYESFPDAGKAFWKHLNDLLKSAMWSHAEVGTEIILPLIEMNKDEVVRLGAQLGVPFEVTWSCYFDADQPCGRCASCIERTEALSAIQDGDRQKRTESDKL